MGPVRMISSGHELTTDYDEKTLHELGFKDMQVLPAYRQHSLIDMLLWFSAADIGSCGGRSVFLWEHPTVF